MEERYKELLLSTEIVNMSELLNMMTVNGFFKSPCSTKHHLCVEGGLLEHSLNVYEMLVKLNEAIGAKLDRNDMIICALLHDLGKMGDYGKPNYVENVLKTGTSKAQPYKTNPDLIQEEHEIRSVIIASRYIDITEEQASAILHHNGLFGKLDSSYGNHNYDSSPLCFLLHTADMYVSRFIETKGKGEE